MAVLTPYIFSKDARTQADFYIHAFGGEILSVLTYQEQPTGAGETVKERVLYLSMVAGGMNFLLSDSLFEPICRGNGIHLSLEFAEEVEAREAFDKLAVGGHVKNPLKPSFWGALFGQIEDKYGVMWMIMNRNEAGQA
ncbi:VOC family protein [Paenibacillus allorhizosphaerae]|uniref:Glyoxalase/fosfomycin resistance/dioxygenase domain-containing protein n=1 Tax=Paenibacillus allorhizosphaerae TaxID=2849866 RepID=A0ABM8VE78_9BACL|nr:VOC family protein [Paenibacillus allorhizosphaerae]CAG7630434.1 hypothetical protein PAECIP111802_01636 [Paenibacillus allorhizosphaerae]